MNVYLDETSITGQQEGVQFWFAVQIVGRILGETSEVFMPSFPLPAVSTVMTTAAHVTRHSGLSYIHLTLDAVLKQALGSFTNRVTFLWLLQGDVHTLLVHPADHRDTAHPQAVSHGSRSSQVGGGSVAS